MFINEYGKRLILNLQYNISGNVGDDGLQLVITKPDGTQETFNKASTSPVSFIGADTTVTDERGTQHRLNANEFIYRDWEDGDLDQDGIYTARVIYNDGSTRLASSLAAFYVQP
jgi:hypothetical protein